MVDRIDPSSAVGGTGPLSNRTAARDRASPNFAPVLRRLDLRGVDGPLRAHLPSPHDDAASDEVVAAVRAIIDDVRNRGDAALAELGRRFDGLTGPVRIDPAEVQRALGRCPEPLVEALGVAADRIERYHRTQLRPPTSTEVDGVRIDSSWRPVRRGGCYVPGGRAAYPSSLLMTALPAKVAGVDEVVVCVPADRSTGAVHDAVLAAAAVAGVDEVYAVGGAQAVAAMAYGTDSMRPVDVICGPGNRYVAVAKREVAGVCGVAAAFAGPSEIVVVADGTVDPSLVAVDLMVQAEHGPDGLAWMVTWDDAVADAVDGALAAMVAEAPRRQDIAATMAASGYAVVVEDPERALEVSNAIAPEHLQLMCEDPQRLVPMVDNAGAVFCGPWSPASLGDYAAGPSHVLPTHGSARFASALTVDDFCRHHHVVTASREGFDALAPTVATLADAEGLDAHALSVRLRSRR